MPTELRWIASLPASALHAAEAILTGRTLIDLRLAAILDRPAQNLAATIEAADLPPSQLLPHLIALSGGIPEPRQLAEVALAKLVHRDQARQCAGAVADAVRQVVAALQAATPDVVEQLALRAEPLRSQWDARGPGLLAALGRLVDPELLAAHADVLLVLPVLGGYGSAHSLFNTVRIEAVLADVNPGLPEVVRLAWLIAQLQCDLPKFQGTMTRDRLDAVAALGMIAAVLTAAEELELARCDPPTVRAALIGWSPTPNSEWPGFEDSLLQWWETLVNTRANWATALAALDKMLCADRTSAVER